ncbi:hypothetical protein GWL_32640 [Herbaspirillum sp. GW103]|nr:hypothetical protein GWL_32640 [Herbaspirillum sp. GW103]
MAQVSSRYEEMRNHSEKRAALTGGPFYNLKREVIKRS